MYYLAIDIGASSGRHILGHLEDGILKLEEIYRFENNIKEETIEIITTSDFNKTLEVGKQKGISISYV